VQPVRSTQRVRVVIAELRAQNLGAMAEQGQRFQNPPLQYHALTQDALGARRIGMIRSERDPPHRQRLVEYRLCGNR
jgi:hypothetical protein